MTKALAKEFGGRGICVNAVCPGTMQFNAMLCDVRVIRLPFLIWYTDCVP